VPNPVFEVKKMITRTGTEGVEGGSQGAPMEFDFAIGDRVYYLPWKSLVGLGEEDIPIELEGSIVAWKDLWIKGSRLPSAIVRMPLVIKIRAPAPTREEMASKARQDRRKVIEAMPAGREKMQAEIDLQILETEAEEEAIAKAEEAEKRAAGVNTEGVAGDGMENLELPPPEEVPRSSVLANPNPNHNCRFREPPSSLQCLSRLLKLRRRSRRRRLSV